MKLFKRVAACALALAMTAALTACEEEGPAPVNSSASTSSESEAAPFTTDDETDREVKEISSESYTPDGNAGKVVFLGWYDITNDQKGRDQSKVFCSEAYGGSIEMISCTPLTSALLEKLGTMIAADESPDLVTKDAWLYPGNASKNTFEALDDYIDYHSPLWADMAPFIEDYAYNGKHYYYPHRTTTFYTLNYNKKTFEENNLDDPYELYKSGNWTWNEWRRLMQEFCDKSEDNIGYYATDLTIATFFSTTGIPLIDVKQGGVIDNNLNDPAITRAMTFLEDMYRDGLAYGKQYGDWVSPQVFAQHCDNILFLGMEPEWSYIAATETIQNPKGTDSDIFGTPSDFAFVPYPRDPDADQYYQAIDTYGFLIPKGAKNIKGAIDWINCFRVYDTDENIIKQTREEHIHPTPEYYTKGPNAGIERWQITWGEQEYDLWREMCDPANFAFITEDAYGFNSEFWQALADAMCDAAYYGGSWTQNREQIMPVIEATLNDFRS